MVWCASRLCSSHPEALCTCRAVLAERLAAGADAAADGAPQCDGLPAQGEFLLRAAARLVSGAHCVRSARRSCHHIGTPLVLDTPLPTLPCASARCGCHAQNPAPYTLQPYITKLAEAVGRLAGAPDQGELMAAGQDRHFLLPLLV